MQTVHYSLQKAADWYQAPSLADFICIPQHAGTKLMVNKTSASNMESQISEGRLYSESELKQLNYVI